MGSVKELNREKIQVVVISLMKREAIVLGGQEIRWGRVARALASTTDYDVRILCTQSILDSWEKYGLKKLEGNTRVFKERRNKYFTWIFAQFFAWKNIPRNAIIHIPGPGWLIAPAVIIAHYLKSAALITSLTSCRIKPLKKVSYREYAVSLQLSKLSAKVDTLNPGIDIDDLIDPGKVTVSPCSFSDPEKYYPADIKFPKVVFAGHLQANKGVDTLIGLLKIWPLTPGYVFFVCGASTIDEEVKNNSDIVRSLAGGNPNIHIMHTDNMASVFSDARIFLSLQTWDNYPSQSLIEAMLSGCAIIATAVGDTGLLVKEPWGEMLPLNADPAIYLEAIKRILALPKQDAKRNGDLARNFILQNHNIERYTAYLKKLWQGVK